MVKCGVVKKKTIFTPEHVCFDGFWWSSPFACLPICLRPQGEGGEGRKQIGRQEEGFSLFGYAAAGGLGIQYK